MTKTIDPSPPLIKIIKINSIIKKLQMDDKKQALDSLQPELNKVLKGEETSWYYELHTTENVQVSQG
mgnify:CR=1 FL=1